MARRRNHRVYGGRRLRPARNGDPQLRHPARGADAHADADADTEAAPSVRSVVFEQLEGDLDDNPSEYGGGKRIFPDASAQGGDPRRRVRVRVQVMPAAANVDVYLRSFDVDDSAGLFDTGRGGDNLGPGVRNDGVPAEGRFEPANASQAAVRTDASGAATATFLVTMQPGDNFRIAAGTRQEIVGRLAVNDRNVRDLQSGRTLAEETAGAFEKGSITVGSGAGAVTFADIEGNGADFVKKDDMTIPFRLVDRAGGNPIPADANQIGSVGGLAAAARQFTISQSVRNVNYVGGTLTVAGVNFTVTQAQGRTVTVREEAALPFLLLDDDRETAPFLVNPPAGNDAQAGTPFEFMQTSTDRNKNPFARAYILPVYDLGAGARARGFDRNLESGGEVAAISRVQDFTSSQDFWVVYLQGAFQGVAPKDADPGSEVTTVQGVTLGETAAATGSDGSLSRIGGAAIFRETIRDVEAVLGLARNTCLKTTVPHETGHQFALVDGSGGFNGSGLSEGEPAVH